MTFRSDREALTMRVTELENELAALEGRELGLDAAIAEGEARTEAALRKRARVDRWRSLRRRVVIGVFTPLGLVLGFTCTTGAAPILAYCATHHSHDAALSGVVATGVVAAGTPCTLRIEEGADDACHARIACGGQTVYAGVGRCATFGDENRIEYWDHASDRVDGTPLCVIAETESVAIVGGVGGGSPLRVRLAEPRSE